MSESTHAKQNSSPNARKSSCSPVAELPFWAISVVLHALLLGSLLLFVPVREIVFKRASLKEAEVITRGDELEDVIEQIRDRTVERLSARVVLLKSGQERMARNFEIINEHFQPYAEQQRTTARERMEKHIADVLPKQAELSLLLGRAVGGADPAEPVAFAHRWLSRILTGQEEVRRGMRLLELGGPELLAKQHAAEDAQYEATQFLRWLEDDLRAIDTNQERLTAFEAELAEKRAKLPEAEVAVTQAKDQLTTAETLYAQCKQQWEIERRTKDKARINAAKTALDAAKRQINDGRRNVTGAEHTLTRDVTAVKNTEGSIIKTQERLKQCREKRDNHLTAGRNVHRGAYQRQKDVVAELRALEARKANSPGDVKAE